MSHRSKKRIPFLVALALCSSAVIGCTSPAERAAFRQLEEIERSTYVTGQPSRSATPLPGQDLPTLDEKATLRDYLTYATRNNPGLEAAFNDWKAALQKVPQARTLPEPRLGYGIFLPDIHWRRSMRRRDFRLEQEFPWPSKLALEADMALQEAHAARERYEAAKLKLLYDVKTAYAECYYLGRTIEITRQNVELMKYLENVARTRYMAAAAGHPDVIKAQVELGKLDNDLRTLLDLGEPQAGKLNAALGRPAKTPVPWPKSLPDEGVTIQDTDLFAGLREANPELKAMAFNVEKEKRGVELAKKQSYPDLMAELDYMDMRSSHMSEPGGEPDEAMVGISFTLPIWREKYRAAEVEAQSQLRAAQLSLHEKQNRLESDVKMALYGLRDAQRKINLYRNALLPKAKESFKTTQMAFTSGKVDFMDLVEAQRVLLEFQLSEERALADRTERLAELEMLVGKDIAPGLPTAPAEGSRPNAPAQ